MSGHQEQVLLVKSGELSAVNQLLASGWTVKMMHAVAETTACTGDFRNETTGSIYLYLVLQRDVPHA